MPSKEPMTAEEILSWVQRFQYAPEFRDERGRKTVPIACFCEFAGVSRRNIYHMLCAKRPISYGMRIRLSETILAVVKGLRWRRIGDHSYEIVDPEKWEQFPRYERPRRGDDLQNVVLSQQKL